jgi:hypothetical protein
VRQKAPVRHRSLALVLTLANDQRPLLRGEVVPLLVGVRDGDLEPFADRPPGAGSM